MIEAGGQQVGAFPGPEDGLTTAELALIPAGTALAGVALGIAGNGYLDRRRERKAAKDQRDRAIGELLTATVDLVTASRLSAWPT